ncbi:MAG TPA: deoxyribonuclease IV [Chloroflexota bacterium]|nr:deoxyribonuclease IV [Chloroflexota bacterium]
MKSSITTQEQELLTSLPPMPALERPLGRHLGTGPGMATAIDAARRIGCTAAQIFPSNPKGWHYVPMAPERAAAANEAWAEAGIRPLVIHAPYIINLASPDQALYQTSSQALRNSLSRGQELGAAFVVVHLGSHKGTGEQAGARRLLEAGLAALDGMPDWLYLLLENNVGAGNTIGASLEALGALVRDAAHPRIGVCIDTAHLWGSGYDLSTAEGAARAVDEVDRAIGLRHVRVLHLNDSPVSLGSHRDQHAHLGQGQIGYQGLASFVTQSGLAGIPVVLETPDGGVEEEIIRLRAAALLCAGDAEGARALQEARLPADTPAEAAET